MKKLLKLSLLLLIQCVVLPLFAQQIDVKHLVLDLKFDWTKKQTYGTASIQFSPLSPTNKITLDAAFLTIQEIRLNDTKLDFTYDGKDVVNGLKISLDKEYPTNSDLTIQIDYHSNYVNKADPNGIFGSFGKGLRFLEPTFTTPKKRKQIWSQGEPDNNRYWFPCKEDLTDLRTTDFIATVEKPLMLIANGVLVDKKDNGDGTQTFHYQTDQPYPNYLTAFVVGEYQDVLMENGNTPIHNFGYPDEVEAVTATVELLPDMMQFITEKTKQPYPYAQYSQVTAQDFPFPGMIGQHTVSTISDNYIDDYGVHKDFKYLWDGIAIQSMASQWFGNLLMLKDWKDLWLNLGFSRYFAGLYTAYQNGNDEYLTYANTFENFNVLSDWNAGNKHPIVPSNVKDVSAFAADSYARFRGALVLRMLQKEVGEKDWWEAVQWYVRENANQLVSTADFQKAIEQVTGKSYQWFFDQWVYKIGLPKFKVSQKYDATKKELQISVKQTAQNGTNEFQATEFFQGHLDIEIDDAIERIYIEPKAKNVFTFSRDQKPKLVHFDFENVWIKELEFDKTTEELIYQLAHSKDVLAKRVAIDELTKIAGNGKTTEQEKDQIKSAFREAILSEKNYWRFKSYALSNYGNIAPVVYDQTTIDMVLELIEKEKSWLKTAAIFFLGNTQDPQYEQIYIDALKDSSDRVINAAAISLGKSKSPKAYDILIALEQKPSWKNQSRISALNGLKELGDPRAVDFALQYVEDNRSARWYLATPIWDYPIAAAETLVAFGKGDLAYPIVAERFYKSIEEDDVNDIFSNVLLISTLGDPRGQEIFDLLKTKYRDDKNAMMAVDAYEKQFKDSLKNGVK